MPRVGEAARQGPGVKSLWLGAPEHGQGGEATVPHSEDPTFPE